MSNKLPLVLDANGDWQQLQISDTLLAPALIVGNTLGEATLSEFTSAGGNGVWLDLPTSGPSGVGTGGAGSNAWLGYCYSAGNWCIDSVPGDLAYRNYSGGRLLWGTSTGNSQMALSTTGLTISTPTLHSSSIAVPTMTSSDNSTNAASTAFVQGAVTTINNTFTALANKSLVYSGNVATSTGTTQIPYGNATPLSTGGTQIWSQTLTPIANTSSFEICFDGMVDCSSSSTTITIALFRGTTCIGFVCSTIDTTNRPKAFSLRVTDIPGVTTATTYSCRIGASASSTWYLGRSASNTMGGTNNSGWSIREVI